MKRIQILTKGDLSTTSLVHENHTYDEIQKQYPFIGEKILMKKWHEKYDRSEGNWYTYEIIRNYELLNNPHYLVGETDKFLIVKFSNGLYTLINKHTKYKEVNLVNLPDELFKM